MTRLLTYSRLKEHLHYDPETGVFTWIVSKKGATRGSRADHLKQNGRRGISFDYCKYLSHRLAWLYMTGSWPTKMIDHIDGDPSNNSWVNLREATSSQNQANKRAQYNNRLGIKGVCRRGNHFSAQIHINGKQLYLGCFETSEEAHAAYVVAATEAFGEFARTA